MGQISAVYYINIIRVSKERWKWGIKIDNIRKSKSLNLIETKTTDLRCQTQWHDKNYTRVHYSLFA